MRNKMLFFVFLVSALVVLSGQVRAEGYVDGLRDGINQCKNDPASCGINVTVNQDTNGSTDDGIKKCQANPSDYGITVDPKDGSIKECQANPSDYGITVDPKDGSTQAGINQCKYDPASCGITVIYDTNGSTQEGIAQCQSNPVYYGITVDPKDGSTQAGIDKCKADTVACGITNDNDFESRKTQFLEKTNGKTDNLLIISDKKILYLPKVVMIDEKGQPTTVSEVYMSYIQPTSNFRNIDLLFQLVEFEMSIDGKVTKFDKNGVPITK